MSPLPEAVSTGTARSFPEDGARLHSRETQSGEWAKLERLHGDRTGEQILGDLCKWMDQHGSLATLRHGFKCYGRTLRAAYFKAAHELNPELAARYAANHLGLTRQLHFSPRSEQSLDMTLSLNGIPVATLELKNPLTDQTVEDACRQYQRDRDPREPIFEFKRRALAHFAVDTDSVLMTTRLAGKATQFLPFDKGFAGGQRAIRPIPPAAATARPICGKRYCNATVCSTFSPASCTCRSKGSATTGATRSGRRP